MEHSLTQLKSNKNEKDAHAKEMESCIESLFRFLIRCKIMTAEQSINDQTKVEPKTQPQNVNVNNTNTKQYVFG
jgi:site-specific recombinase XerD